MYPNVIPIDDRSGARVCGALVIYNTIIPVLDAQGEPQIGTLFATVERVVDGQFVGATSTAEANFGATVDLDPNAAAYTVPDGWLPDGATEVVC